MADEQALVALTISRLKQLPGVRVIGDPTERLSIVSFLIDDCHPHDIGTLLDQQGVAVRTGHHCAMPLMQRLEIPGTIRASFRIVGESSSCACLIKNIDFPDQPAARVLAKARSTIMNTSSNCSGAITPTGARNRM